jgi:predicted amino acid dehydrogenase
MKKKTGLIRILQSKWRINKKSKNRNDIHFSFIAHPRHLNDVFVALPILKFFSENTVKKILKRIWPLLTSVMETEIKTPEGKTIKGEFITIPATPDMLFRDLRYARTQINQGITLSKNIGAEVVGLGALLPPVVGGGRYIKKDEDIKVTTGYSFSTHIVMKNIEYLSKILDVNLPETSIGIIGANQKTARFIALELNEKVKHIYLYDRVCNIKKLQRTNSSFVIGKEEINHEGHPVVLNFPDHLNEVDIILNFTSHADLEVISDHVKPGCIIIDDTQPHGISKELAQQRPDILVVDGGLATLPGFNPHFNFGLMNKDEMWGCLGETILLSWLQQHGYNQEDADYEKNPEGAGKLISMAFDKMGFQIAPPRSFSKIPLDQKHIEKIKTGRKAAVL